MSYYLDTHRSVLKICNDFAAANGMTVFDFDAHATNNEFPDADIIGPWQFSFETDEGMFTVATMIGISTLNDANLFRLREKVDALFAALQPNKTYSLYDASTSSPYGIMKVMNGTSVSPVARSNERPVQFVAVTLGTDQKMLVP